MEEYWWIFDRLIGEYHVGWKDMVFTMPYMSLIVLLFEKMSYMSCNCPTVTEKNVPRKVKYILNCPQKSYYLIFKIVYYERVSQYAGLTTVKGMV